MRKMSQRVGSQDSNGPSSPVNQEAMRLGTQIRDWNSKTQDVAAVRAQPGKQ